LATLLFQEVGSKGGFTMFIKRNMFWLFSLVVGMLFLTPARAEMYQGGGDPGQMGGHGGRRGAMMSPDDRLKAMTKDFELTADQQSKIKPILADEQKKMQDLRNDSNGDRQAMRGKMMQIHQDSSDQIRATLDDKQKEKFDKQQQERRQRMQNRRRGAPGMGGSGGPDAPGDAPQN